MLWMWHSFYCLNFSLYEIQEIFEQQISRASITEIKLQALLCSIQYNGTMNGLTVVVDWCHTPESGRVLLHDDYMASCMEVYISVSAYSFG